MRRNVCKHRHSVQAGDESVAVFVAPGPRRIMGGQAAGARRGRSDGRGREVRRPVRQPAPHACPRERARTRTSRRCKECGACGAVCLLCGSCVKRPGRPPRPWYGRDALREGGSKPAPAVLKLCMPTMAGHAAAELSHVFNPTSLLDTLLEQHRRCAASHSRNQARVAEPAPSRAC